MIPDDFLLRALMAGIGVALVAGPVGCFVVWRRMAYFGDTLAHGSLLGIAGGLFLGILPAASVFAGSLLIAGLLLLLERRRDIAPDTALGVLAHAALAIGLVGMALVPGVRVDLQAYLFGDVLAVSADDISVIWGGGAAALALLAFLWRTLLAATVDPDMALAEGMAVGRARAGLILLFAVIVATAMKVVGVLLITALLIIPAAAARPLARTPEGMALMAAVAGVVAVCGGLGLSMEADTPAGPSIVVCAVVLFALTHLGGRLVRRPA